MYIKKILLILLFTVLASCETSEEGIIKGKVVKVADGDTITIVTEEGEKVKIRLEGIDAPEKGQDFSQKSRQFLNDLCYGKDVRVKDKGKDKYGRTLGVVYIDDLNINEEMVRNGLAWYYSYFVEDARLDSLEKQAQKERLNIWSMKDPIHPHDFRKNKRK
ncbi:MAG: thermonuclease family protein [Dysgonomonas sp.]|nr:thermonuclease family protein [Dysgonomonas sp.]